MLRAAPYASGEVAKESVTVGMVLPASMISLYLPSEVSANAIASLRVSIFASSLYLAMISWALALSAAKCIPLIISLASATRPASAAAICSSFAGPQ